MNEATIAELLRTATTALQDAGVPSPQRDAEWLLAHVLNCRRADLFANALQAPPATATAAYQALVGARTTRKPLQYILETAAFYGRDFLVTPDVLIPRPETEELVERVVRDVGSRDLQVLDIGTGSGCIAVTLALECPGAVVTATDQSVPALLIARENARRHDVLPRVRLLAADCFPDDGRAFDLVVSNPPYLSAAEWATAQPEVRTYEPKTALVGGDDGLAIIRRIIDTAPSRVQGVLYLEIGAGQDSAVAALCAAGGAYATPEFFPDVHGVTRCVKVRTR